ncbi:ATP-binding protein [Afifella sp. JA880]|uniref:ATP-binding protein n=1 Tax=Afifella sp. JA880 TaxID=2975280 RepID=UPI0021BB109C|nr:ATP-binding protein [Afifella sp. JA880]MCT8269012.1 ATP-binding protein [Afifella sp. JA880]
MNASASRETLVVNILGGPGVGKSTFAAGLFSDLKRRHIACELVAEVTKRRIWEGRPHAIANKITILGEQWAPVEELLGKVDVIVVDGCVLLASVYAAPHYPTAFHELCIWCHKSVRRLDVLIARPQAEYETFGRLESGEEALRIDARVEDLVRAHADDEVIAVADHDDGRTNLVGAILQRIAAD